MVNTKIKSIENLNIYPESLYGVTLKPENFQMYSYTEIFVKQVIHYQSRDKQVPKSVKLSFTPSSSNKVEEPLEGHIFRDDLVKNVCLEMQKNLGDEHPAVRYIHAQIEAMTQEQKESEYFSNRLYEILSDRILSEPSIMPYLLELASDIGLIQMKLNPNFE